MNQNERETSPSRARARARALDNAVAENAGSDEAVFLVGAPRVGPIVGEATENALRIFVAAGPPAAAERRAMLIRGRRRRRSGVAILVRAGGGGGGGRIAHRVVKLDVEHDSSGVLVFTGLDPGATYAYAAMIVEGDDGSRDDVERIVERAIRTAPPAGADLDSDAGTAAVRRAADGVVGALENRKKELAARATNAAGSSMQWIADAFRSGGSDADRRGYVASEVKILAAPAPAPAPATSFLLASCRYVNETMGFFFGDEKSDRAYREMLAQCRAPFPGDNTHHTTPPATFAVFCGDQIYADDGNQFSEDELLDDFRKKYRHTFSTPHFSALVRSTPTFMTLDDHEISDNFPQNFSPKRDGGKLAAAMRAYQTYQASHSPLFAVANRGTPREKIVGTPDKWWYAFATGMCDFFVMDTRTERRLIPRTRPGGRRPVPARIVSPDQLAALKNWFADGSGRVKCVVAGVLFLVDYLDGEDSFGDRRFVHQRDEILDFLDSPELVHVPVVFLGGDVHVSMAGRAVSRATGRSLTQIVSSPVFWPFPFGQGSRDDYALDGFLARGDDHAAAAAGAGGGGGGSDAGAGARAGIFEGPPRCEHQTKWALEFADSYFVRENNFTRVCVRVAPAARPGPRPFRRGKPVEGISVDTDVFDRRGNLVASASVPTTSGIQK